VVKAQCHAGAGQADLLVGPQHTVGAGPEPDEVGLGIEGPGDGDQVGRSYLARLCAQIGRCAQV
jgi:hypothetical protein